MKKLIISSLLVINLGATLSQAQSAIDTSPTTLAATMKAMSSALKTVSAQATDSHKNSDSAILADQFVQLTLNSKKFTPDTISGLPANEQMAQKAQYDQMIDQTADLGKQLAEAFRNNDNTKAADLLNQLLKSKKEGHAQFK